MKLKIYVLWKSFGTKSVNFFLAISLIFAALSCGKRTTSITEGIVKRDTLEVHTIKKDIKIDSNYVIDFLTFKIQPIDYSKPIILDGHKIENAIIEGVKKKETGSVKKIDKTIIKDLKKGAAVEKKKAKEVEKIDNSNIWVGVAFVVAFVVALFIFAYLKTPNLKKPSI